MPVPDSLRAELRHYMIGRKLRALRLRRSMGLVQLGHRAGLSPALLSKIENGKLVPTVPTLLRIAMVFDVPLEHFFRNEHMHRIISITRKEEREQRQEAETDLENSCRLTRLDLGSGERKFQTYLAEFMPAPEAGARPHLHQGFEFIHVLSGTLQLLIGDDETLLRRGDSIYFDSGLRHAYGRVSEAKCMALMVLAPPEPNLFERRMDRLEGVHALARTLRNSLNDSPQQVQPGSFMSNGTPRAKKDLQESA